MNENTICIDVYTDTILRILGIDDNISVIEVKRDVALDYFLENHLEDFRGDDKDITDSGLFEEWLSEYTCDDKQDLYRYALSKGAVISVEIGGFSELVKKLCKDNSAEYTEGLEKEIRFRIDALEADDLTDNIAACVLYSKEHGLDALKNEEDDLKIWDYITNM